MSECDKVAENGAVTKPKLGISSCLLGERVRYDGGHSRDGFLADTLGRFVKWVPVCPEVECGLGIPRESMQQEGDYKNPRLVTTHTGQDLTDRMLSWAERRVQELEREGLVGFIFKSNSPSSGMIGVRVFDRHGMAHKVGVGLFARAFMDHFPLVPVEEDERLHDLGTRKNFIERVFCLARRRLDRIDRDALYGLIEGSCATTPER